MTTRAKLTYISDFSQLNELKTLVVIGRADDLRGASIRGHASLDAPTWETMIDSCDPGDGGSSTGTWRGGRHIVIGVLPEVCSRHNAPSRAWAIPSLAKHAISKDNAGVVLVLRQDDHAFASALAAARAFRAYSARSGSTDYQEILVATVGPNGPVHDERIQAGMDAVRYAAKLVDMPTSLLHSEAFADEARSVAERCSAELTLVQGRDLERKGFGGIWGVGKAASKPPVLAVLKHQPEGADRTIAWVGKGIVYDTGGLSIKGKEHMPGMKADMAGAAAILAAFEAAVATGFPQNLVAILCIAENAVGPEATRPDDIHWLYSGKSVEINNTDAEGRLVLADGVAWACKELQPDWLLDMATLTGAALISTGRTHSGVYTNSASLEAAAVAAGLHAGEPCHPMVYAPELFRKEFSSTVADMKNSVKDRMNAQSSCAGQFIGNHLPETPPAWIHVDIAGPATDSSNNGTGYGVGLLLQLGTGPDTP
jgi:probable aminopeptidase NPEPL1